MRSELSIHFPCNNYGGGGFNIILSELLDLDILWKEKFKYDEISSYLLTMKTEDQILP